MSGEKIGELIKELEQWNSGEFKVVVMPHFCVDISVKYGGNYPSFMEKLEVIRKQEGGNIVVDQSMGVGGKAANCASDFLRKMTRVDFHTKEYVASYGEGGETGRIPTFNVKPFRLTGAGDAWSAGNILGDVMDLRDELRLILANAVAAYYISHPQGKHPGIEDVVEFVKKSEF